MGSPFSIAVTSAVACRYGKESHCMKKFYHNSVMKEKKRTEGSFVVIGERKGLILMPLSYQQFMLPGD
jgi:hypothetical protein